MSDGRKDVILTSENEAVIDEVVGEVQNVTAADAEAVLLSKRPLSSTADDGTTEAQVMPDGITQAQIIPSSTADDGITQAEVIPSPPSSSSAVSSLTTESVTDNAGVPLADGSADTDGKQEQSRSESDLIPSSSNQDAAQSVVPTGQLSVVSMSDDLELFFRQLSHMACKTDSDDAAAVDILTEFDEVISQLDTSSGDFDIQNDFAPKEHFLCSDITENFHSTENNVENSNSTATHETDSLHITAQGGKMLASAAASDKDADGDDTMLECSKSFPFSALLHCEFEPPYLPITGM